MTIQRSLYCTRLGKPRIRDRFTEITIQRDPYCQITVQRIHTVISQSNIRSVRSQRKGFSLWDHDTRIVPGRWQHNDPIVRSQYKDHFCEMTIQWFLLWDQNTKIFIVKCQYRDPYYEIQRTSLWDHNTGISLLWDYSTRMLIVRPYHSDPWTFFFLATCPYFHLFLVLGIEKLLWGNQTNCVLDQPTFQKSTFVGISFSKALCVFHTTA